jgi:hypothetical protein
MIAITDCLPTTIAVATRLQDTREVQVVVAGDDTCFPVYITQLCMAAAFLSEAEERNQIYAGGERSHKKVQPEMQQTWPHSQPPAACRASFVRSGAPMDQPQRVLKRRGELPCWAHVLEACRGVGRNPLLPSRVALHWLLHEAYQCWGVSWGGRFLSLAFAMGTQVHRQPVVPLASWTKAP